MTLRRLALVAVLASAWACSSGPDAEDEARTIQVDLHRAFLTSKSLGRFGEFGLFEQEMEKVPCRAPLSATQRTCDVTLIGNGAVRLRVAGPELEASRHLRPNALVSVELQADCGNQPFDFKTMDLVLQRGPTRDGVTVWENRLVRVTHRRRAAGAEDRCTLHIEAAPALLARLASGGRQAVQSGR